MTNDTPTPDDPGATREVAFTVTGEVYDLDDSTEALAAAVRELNGYIDEVMAVRRTLADEVCARMDRENVRSLTVGGFALKANAPTTESYDVGKLRAKFAPLVEDGIVSPELLERLTPYPEPPAPQRRVAKPEVNKLKRSDGSTPEGRRILAALAACRDIVPAKRTLGVERLEPAQ